MNKAFTLIEYLVVIGIIAILSAALVPSIQTYLPGLQLTGASRNLVNHLRQAQEEAITTQFRRAIRFSQAAPFSYQIIEKNELSEETILQTINLPGDLGLTLDGTIADREIVFSSDGGPSSNGNIKFLLGSSEKTINISASGVIKISQ